MEGLASRSLEWTHYGNGVVSLTSFFWGAMMDLSKAFADSNMVTSHRQRYELDSVVNTSPHGRALDSRMVRRHVGLFHASGTISSEPE